MLSFLGTLLSALLGGAGSLFGLGGGSSFVGPPLSGMGGGGGGVGGLLSGGANLVGALGPVLGPLLAGKPEPQGPLVPAVFQPSLIGVQPGSQAFFAAPQGSVIKQTPLLQLAKRQAKATAAIQQRFVKSTIAPQLRVIQRASKAQAKAQQRQLKDYLQAQTKLRRLEERGRDLTGRKAQRLLAVEAPVLPAFNLANLTPFQTAGIRVF